MKRWKEVLQIIAFLVIVILLIAVAYEGVQFWLNVVHFYKP